jgi:putative membrane protein
VLSDRFRDKVGTWVAVEPPAVPTALLAWYCGFLALLSISPLDRQNWLLVNILPLAFVATLAVSYRRLPFSPASYAMLTLFLTLHTIGAHYTYARVPVGSWLAGVVGSGRNDYDRLVHFAFGLLATYPLFELFARPLNGVALPCSLAGLTQVGLSGLWEVLESLVAHVLHPDLGAVYLGSQGDPWDAQHDMAAAFLGSMLCLAVVAFAGRARGSGAPARPLDV